MPSPCGHEGDYRGRPILGSTTDQADRARIHAEIAATYLALRT